jgi:hypothetical protein
MRKYLEKIHAFVSGAGFILRQGLCIMDRFPASKSDWLGLLFPTGI